MYAMVASEMVASDIGSAQPDYRHQLVGRMKLDRQRVFSGLYAVIDELELELELELEWDRNCISRVGSTHQGAGSS